MFTSWEQRGRRSGHHPPSSAAPTTLGQGLGDACPVQNRAMQFSGGRHYADYVLHGSDGFVSTRQMHQQQKRAEFPTTCGR